MFSAGTGRYCLCFHLQAFNRGCTAKLVLQTAGGSVFTTEEESRAHLEQTCARILNGSVNLFLKYCFTLVFVG